MTGTFTTAELDSTEQLAIIITREHFASGDIDHEEFERRIRSLIGLDGEAERERVLHTDHLIDITHFGFANFTVASAWTWPT